MLQSTLLVIIANRGFAMLYFVWGILSFRDYIQSWFNGIFICGPTIVFVRSKICDNRLTIFEVQLPLNTQ